MSLFWALLLIFPNSVYSQFAVVDSLEKELLAVPKNTRQHSEILGQLCWNLRSTNLPKALDYGLAAINIAQKSNNPDLERRHLAFVGIVHRNFGDYATALEYQIRVFTLAQQSQDSTQIAYSFNNIGELYAIQGDFSSAEDHLLKAIDIFKSFNDPVGLAYAYLRYGEMLTEQKKYSQALSALEMSYKIRLDDNNFQALGSAVERISKVYYNQGKIDSALTFALRSLSLREKYADNSNTTAVKTTIAQIYLDQGNIGEAQKYAVNAFENAISEQSDKRIIESANVLAEVYTKLNQFEKANYYRKVQVEQLQNQFADQSSQLIEWISGNLQYERQKRELESIKEARSRQRLIGIVGLAILLVLVVLLAIIWRSRKKEKLINQLLEERNAEISQTNKQLSHAQLLLEQTGSLAQLGGWEYDLRTQQIEWSAMTKIIHEVDLGYEPTLDSAINFYREGKDRELIQSAVQKAIESGEPWDLDLQITTAKGNEIWVKTIGKADFENGKCIRLFGAFQDINQQKLDKIELDTAKKMAEDANRAKSEFLANMSHELRTPLNGVIGFTDLLMKTNLSDEQKNFMEMVNTSGKNLMEVINQILDFSKIEAGKLELTPEPTHLESVAEEVINIVKFQADQKQLPVSVSIPTSLPNFVEVDSFRLRQILANLLSNAIKFTHQGEVILEINSKGIDNNGIALIRFSVKDSGIGIDKTSYKRIFEAFTQVDTSTTRTYGGTGLGLSIAHKILSVMGSEMHLESTLGKGSEFFFDLELPVIDSQTTIKDGDISDEQKSESFDGREIKVMVVEDNAINIFLAKTICKQIGSHINVVEANNGEEAVKLYKETLPDVIFMDLQMPVMNGFESTAAIRAYEKTIERTCPIIALTAGIVKGEQEKCFDAGMNDYLIKPIVVETVRSAIEKHLTVEMIE